MKLSRGVFAVSLLLFASCASLSKLALQSVQAPKLHFQNASLQSISLDSATVLATFNVDNPNSFALKMAGGKYGFSLDGQKLFDGALDDALELPPTKTTSVSIPVTVAYSAIPNLLTTLTTKDKAPYQVDGAVNVKTPISAIEVPFTWKGTLPIPKVPSLNISNAKIDHMSLTSMRLVVSLGVTNPNDFPVPLEKIAADLKLQDQSITHIGLSAPRALAPHQVTTVDLPVELSLANAGSAISKALSGSSSDVKLVGEAVMGGRTVPIQLSTSLR